MLAVKLPIPLLFAIPALLIAGSTPSSIALTSSQNPSILGRTVTLIAAIAPPTATGKVTFYDGTTVLGTATLSAGQTALNTILLPSGARNLKAFYSGDSNYAPSASAALAQTVSAVPGGGFAAAVNYITGPASSAIAIADFNGDGVADLVVGKFTAGDVSVLLGKGDGTFQPPMNTAAAAHPGSIAVADFNADGKTDLITGDYSGSALCVNLGNGDGTFQPPVCYPSGGISEPDVAVGDFNGDGKADLATAGYGGVSVLLGNGDGTFQSASVTLVTSIYFGEGYPVVLGDFDGDGNTDIAVVVLGGTNVSVLLGNGDGTFRAAANLAVGDNPSSIAKGDFNNDGKTDLAVSNGGDSNVSVLLGKGDGTFQLEGVFPGGSSPSDVVVLDFNGDGNADLAIANNGGVNVMLGNGDGTFRVPANYSAGAIPYAIAVGNFNGDGRADLATANFQDAGVSVLLAAVPAPVLSIVITHGGSFAQGQSGAAYAIIVSNVGLAPTSGTVTVTDSLPDGLVATNIAGPGWTCALATLVCTRADPLAPGLIWPSIFLTVNIASNAPGGVTNTASVSGGGQIGNAASAAADFTITFTASEVAQSWSALTLPNGPISPGAALLMTDGTVLVHQICTGKWSRLKPGNLGSYTAGTWSSVGPMPSGYGPLDFSSAVLADGRLIVIGGEYNNNCNVPADTNLGAIYDPVANVWAPLSAPASWSNVGDASNVVLPNGQFLLADIFGLDLARLDPATLTWTSLNGTGKADANEEEGWTLLPDGTVLAVDVEGQNHSETYSPRTGVWASAGNPVVPLNGLSRGSPEMGPQVLRPNGTVFVAGASGHTGVYDVAAGVWAAGPDFPVSNGVQLVNNDGPASLLPSGNVLVTAFPDQLEPGPFFEFDGVNLNPVPPPPTAFCYALLSLPTGQVLCTTGGPAGIFIYTPGGSPDPAWAPTIANAPGAVQPQRTYAIAGTQFNGLSQAVAYGDDYQGATNYPLVRITNTATGHVFYCRTHNHSTMAVATGSAPVSTQFDVPASIESGASTLVVVANGIPSQPWNLTVNNTQSGAAPAIQAVEGSGISVPPVTTISTNGFFTIFGTNLAPAGTARSVTSSDVVNGFLPANLASTCVIAGSAPAFLTYISPTQINAIAPALPITGSAAVSVIANCGGPNQITSPAMNVPVAAASPEFLYWVQNANGEDPVVAVDALHGGYIGPPGVIPGLTFRPAVAGDILTIYGIGFGQTAAGPVPGALPSAADRVPPGYSISIGGTTASASYAGVTPTDAGLYQVNVTIPAGLAPGNYPIVLNVNGGSTPTGAFLTIGP